MLSGLRRDGAHRGFEASMGRETRRVIVVAADLFFQSKIRATAEVTGAEVAFISSASELKSALDSGGVDLIVVNLEAKSPDPMAGIALARAGGVRSVGFANHVYEDLMARARAAGCDQVLAKGAFAKELAGLLGGMEG